MFHAFLIFILVCSHLHGSVAEFYGADTKAMALAGQSNYNTAQANYYGAASLAFVSENQVAVSLSDINMQFAPIDNIVIANSVNSNQTRRVGRADLDYSRQQILSLHASFNFLKLKNSRIGLSMFMPMDKAFEINTADSYRPHYPLYQSRFLRTQLFMNYIQKISDRSAFSIGALTSFNSQGETYVLAQENGSTDFSSAKMNVDAQFKFSLLFSYAHKWNKQHQSFMSFQNKTHSRLQNRAQGLTPIGSASLAFDWKMSSQLSFDPAIYRLSHAYRRNGHGFIATLEYQDWQGYEGPTLGLANKGGILASSQDVKNFETKNILIPRLAYEYHWEVWSLSWGLSYRPTPIEIKQDSPGNQLDLDFTTYAMGIERRLRLSQQDFAIYLAGQYNQLNERSITKSPGLENGLTGDKIGSPGYTGAGEIWTLSLGANWRF